MRVSCRVARALATMLWGIVAGGCMTSRVWHAHDHPGLERASPGQVVGAALDDHAILHLAVSYGRGLPRHLTADAAGSPEATGGRVEAQFAMEPAGRALPASTVPVVIVDTLDEYIRRASACEFCARGTHPQVLLAREDGHVQVHGLPGGDACVSVPDALVERPKGSPLLPALLTPFTFAFDLATFPVQFLLMMGGRC